MARMTEESLEERLERLAHVHRSPGRRRLEETAVRPCVVLGCAGSGGRFLRGHLCPSHAPARFSPRPVPASPPRPVPVYGSATTDPLGRTVIDPRSRLPRRAEA